MDRSDDEDPLSHIQDRIDLCRRLASSTTDREVAKVLAQMANEGEADLAKLRAERDERSS
ncbi:MAG TPA: hypothetical protein VGE68_10120 [Sphingomicrobium sp.]